MHGLIGTLAEASKLLAGANRTARRPLPLTRPPPETRMSAKDNAAVIRLFDLLESRYALRVIWALS
ncbi:MAG: hypothetical protein U1E12_13830, partial [Hydrogenophaga sp.]|nr:hypothetical protein [Hydrogenophaga sp.]